LVTQGFVTLRIDYKLYPITPIPAFPSQNTIWRPVLNVLILYNRKRSKVFEAIVDTGSPYSLFNAQIGETLGMDVRGGIEGPLSGVIGGAKGSVYYHNVRLYAAGEYLDIRAGFSYELSVSALLGQNGFFDNFIVTFDNTTNPPCFEVNRIQRN